jgi:C4-dicarboxylate transporter DctM subunit
MIAIVFLLGLLAVTIFAAATGTETLPIAEILMLVGIFVLFFGSGVYIAAVLGILGVLIGFLFSDRPWWAFMGQTLWGPSSNFVLVAVPLFLLMGEILLRAGLSDRLYRALNVWLNRMPGGLLHTNIVSCAVFSAISGSSVATAATMGSVALPYFQDTKYSQRMVLGSLAAGGALGNLIPPGITFIIYGLITETSVGALYIAAIIPSLLVTGLFILVILAHGLTHPMEKPAKLPLAMKLRALLDLVPTLLLILLVLGSIYGGFATDTTHAECFGRSDCAQYCAAWAHSFWRLPAELYPDADQCAAGAGRHDLWSAHSALGHYALHYRAVRGTRYLHGRLFHDHHDGARGFSDCHGAGLRSVIVTMLVEIAQISPPDGTVMYVLQGMRKRAGPITDVFAGVMPFLAVYLLAVALLMIFPSLALWLPSIMS